MAPDRHHTLITCLAFSRTVFPPNTSGQNSQEGNTETTFVSNTMPNDNSHVHNQGLIETGHNALEMDSKLPVRFDRRPVVDKNDTHSVGAFCSSPKSIKGKDTSHGECRILDDATSIRIAVSLAGYMSTCFMKRLSVRQ